MDSSHVAAPRRPTEEDIAELERIFRIICAAHPLSVGKKASAKDRESMPIKRSGLTCERLVAPAAYASFQ